MTKIYTSATSLLLCSVALGAFGCKDFTFDKEDAGKPKVLVRERKAEDKKQVKKEPPVKSTEAPPVAPPKNFSKPPGDAKKTKKGVSYKFLVKGPREGDRPKDDDSVVVKWTGWTSDGKVFDGSSKKGAPTTHSLQRVIDGWADGLKVMQIGDRTRFWVPEELGYRGQKNKPSGDLVFDIELVDIIRIPESHD